MKMTQFKVKIFMLVTIASLALPLVASASQYQICRKDRSDLLKVLGDRGIRVMLGQMDANNIEFGDLYVCEKREQMDIDSPPRTIGIKYCLELSWRDVNQRTGKSSYAVSGDLNPRGTPEQGYSFFIWTRHGNDCESYKSN